MTILNPKKFVGTVFDTEDTKKSSPFEVAIGFVLLAVLGAVVFFGLPVLGAIALTPVTDTLFNPPAYLLSSVVGWVVTGLFAGLVVGLLRCGRLASGPVRSSAVGEFVAASSSGLGLGMALTHVVVGAGVGLAMGVIGAAGPGSELAGYSDALIQTSGYGMTAALDAAGLGGSGGGSIWGTVFALLLLAIALLLVTISIASVLGVLSYSIRWLTVKGAVAGGIQGGASAVGIRIIEKFHYAWELDNYVKFTCYHYLYPEGSPERRELLAWIKRAKKAGVTSRGELLLSYREPRDQPPPMVVREFIEEVRNDFKSQTADEIWCDFVFHGMITGALVGVIVALIGLIVTAYRSLLT